MAKRRMKLATRRVISKLVSIPLIIVAIFIFASVGKKVKEVYELNQQAELVSQELERLRDENASLVSIKNKLEDPSYVATYARGEYMFSRDDEKVFYLPASEE